MRIAVLDDEKIFCDMIKGVILNHKPDIVVDTFVSVKSLLNTMDHQYDLLLLDIEMPGTNGIDFARHFKGRFPYIVYVTSHDECVFDSFDTNILGFVLKNQLEDRLIQTIDRVLEHQEEIVVLPTTLGDKSIAIDQILYFYIDESGAIVAVTNQKNYYMNVKSLKQLYKLLDENKFCFVNRRELINVKHIVRIYRQFHHLLMSDERRIEVSKRRWRIVLDKYNKEALL